MRRLCLTLLLVLAWVGTVCAASSPEDRRAATGCASYLRAAQFVVSESPTPPAQGWAPLSLPDNWRVRHPRLSGFAWYQIHFRLASLPARPCALYVPHVSLAGEFWLNGSLLNPGVRYDTADGRMGSSMGEAPLYLILPSGLFRSGDNVIDVRLQGDTRVRSGLSAITLASPDALQHNWRQRYTLQVVMPYILLVAMACATCFLAVHLWRRRQLYIIQFGMVAGVIAISSYLSMDLRISRVDEQAIRVVVTTVMYWILCVAGYRIAGVRVRWFLPLLHSVSALTVLFTLGSLIINEMTDRIWLITWPHIALRAVVVVLLLRRARLNRSWKYALLAITAGLWLITIAQSNLILMERLPWDSFRWSIAGALPFCVMLLFFFAGRFILDREEAVLQQRVAIVAERARILQDMHDGMGAHLITALHLARRSDVDRGDLARAIEESLQDLRLIIDSLDLTERDVLPLLGNLRFRLEPRLAALGIKLEWDVLPPLPTLNYLTPNSALAILRVVQEAINNAIRHAQPGMVRITARVEPRWVLIRVSDDGCGFVPEASHQGRRGLSGMQSRAASLGATLIVDSSQTGTCISLQLPRSMTGVAAHPGSPGRD